MGEIIVMGEAQEALEFWEKVEMDKNYFNTPQPQMYIIEEAIRQLELPSPARICEFGCGMGRNLAYLREKRTEDYLYGIDCNERSINIAKQNYTNIHFEVGSLKELKGFCEVIFTVSMLDHVPNPIDYLNKFMLSANNILLLELQLPTFGRIDDPNIIDFSYSHDYENIFKDPDLIVPISNYTSKPVQLAPDGFLSH